MQKVNIRRYVLLFCLTVISFILMSVLMIDLSELVITSRVPNQLISTKVKNNSLKNTRKYQNSRQELDIFKNVIIRPKVCETNVITIFVYSVSETSGKYYDRRQTARNTWVKDAIRHNICVYFVIAQPEDTRTQTEIELEAFRHRDMIQFAFVEDYYNLTLKSVSVLYYIRSNVKSDLIMKTDDDIIFNIELLVKMKDTFRSGISGRVIAGLRPDRNESGRQYIPECIYPNRTLPKFTTGLAYVITRDVISRLIRTYERYLGPIIDIEDVFITGLIAESAKIKRHDRKEFCSYYRCPKRMCFMFDCIVFNGCQTSLQINNFWIHWRQLSADHCFDYLEELIALVFFLLVILLVINFFYFK